MILYCNRYVLEKLDIHVICVAFQRNVFVPNVRFRIYGGAWLEKFKASPQIDECDRCDEIEVLVVQRQPKGNPSSNACKNDLSNTFPPSLQKTSLYCVGFTMPAEFYSAKGT